MKVTGPGSAAPASSGGAIKRDAGAGFSLSGADAAQEAPATGAVAGAAGIGSLDALIALQGAPDPKERRRRAVRRAGRLLDVLDQVKLSMLEGQGAGPALERLRGAVREARDGVDDPRLEGVLDEIETRAAVELAKQEVARRAA